MRFAAPLLPVGPPAAPAGPAFELPVEARDTLRAALERRAHGHAVIVFDEGEARVELRDDLVRRYRRAGVRELVAKLRGAVVPAGHALCLVDLERGTRVITLPLERLFGVDGGAR